MRLFAALSSDPAERLGYVLVITFLVGLLCLLFGLLRLGFIVNFISKPVLNGFASAAAIITSVSVVKVRVTFTLGYCHVSCDTYLRRLYQAHFCL